MSNDALPDQDIAKELSGALDFLDHQAVDDPRLGRVARAVRAALESGESHTEWGVRWVDEDEVEQEKGSEVYARGVVRLFPGTAELMCRTVRVGQWVAAEQAGAS